MKKTKSHKYIKQGTQSAVRTVSFSHQVAIEQQQQIRSKDILSADENK
jgi:hypothetical protein